LKKKNQQSDIASFELPNCKKHALLTPFPVAPFKRERVNVRCESLCQNNNFDVFDLINQHLSAHQAETLTLQSRVPRRMSYMDLLQLRYRPNLFNATNNNKKDHNLTERQL